MVSVTSATGYRGDIRAGRHRLVADEGPDVGGDDKGPNPYQLLLAGLVQCTAATLRMYANRKGWALGTVTVRARLLRTGDGATKVERIERSITVDGELSDDQKRRLSEIAAPR
jgi:putative redox protein